MSSYSESEQEIFAEIRRVEAELAVFLRRQSQCGKLMSSSSHLAKPETISVIGASKLASFSNTPYSRPRLQPFSTSTRPLHASPNFMSSIKTSPSTTTRRRSTGRRYGNQTFSPVSVAADSSSPMNSSMVSAMAKNSYVWSLPMWSEAIVAQCATFTSSSREAAISAFVSTAASLSDTQLRHEIEHV